MFQLRQKNNITHIAHSFRKKKLLEKNHELEHNQHSNTGTCLVIKSRKCTKRICLYEGKRSVEKVLRFLTFAALLKKFWHVQRTRNFDIFTKRCTWNLSLSSHLLYSSTYHFTHSYHIHNPPLSISLTRKDIPRECSIINTRTPTQVRKTS